MLSLSPLKWWKPHKYPTFINVMIIERGLCNPLKRNIKSSLWFFWKCSNANLCESQFLTKWDNFQYALVVIIVCGVESAHDVATYLKWCITRATLEIITLFLRVSQFHWPWNMSFIFCGPSKQSSNIHILFIHPCRYLVIWWSYTFGLLHRNQCSSWHY